MSLSPTFPRPGELVADKYLLTAILGGNDQCIVYEARQRPTQRRVALRLSLSPADEAQGDDVPATSGQSHHPGVLEVLDVLREPGGCVCSVLDWRAGESLEAYLSRTGPLPIAEVGRLLLPCIRGVIAEHLTGVVRHAIETTTLYVCASTPDEPEQTKLLPFELDTQRALQLLLAGPSALTAANGGQRLPEALAALRADPRTEVRAFGAIAYRALTGRPASAVQDAQPVPGREDVPPPVLPPIVRWFIERALSDDCERPFQTLEELATALESMTSAIAPAPTARTTPLEPPTVPRRSTPGTVAAQPIAARRITPIDLPQPALPPLPTCLDAPAREITPSRSAPRGTAALHAAREDTPSITLPRAPAEGADASEPAAPLEAARASVEPRRAPPTLQLAGSPIDAGPGLPAPPAQLPLDAQAQPPAPPPSAAEERLQHAPPLPPQLAAPEIPPPSAAEERVPSLRATLRLGTASQADARPSVPSFRTTLPLDVTVPVSEPAPSHASAVPEAPANVTDEVTPSVLPGRTSQPAPAAHPHVRPAHPPSTPHVERSRQLRAARATVTTVLPRTRVLNVLALGRRMLQVRSLAYLAGALVLAAGLLTFLLDGRRAPSADEATTDVRAATQDPRAENAQGAAAPARIEAPPAPPQAAEPQPEVPAPVHPTPRAAARSAPGPTGHARSAPTSPARETGLEDTPDVHKELPPHAPALRVAPLTPPAKAAPADALDKMNLL